MKGLKHVSGGCLVGPLAVKKKFSCDDIYRDESGVEFVFETTPEAHFSMPMQAKSLDQLARLPGVRLWTERG